MARIEDRSTQGMQGAGAVFRSLRWIFRHLARAYLRLEVQGVEQIPRDGGAIIAGNHPSVLDGILLMAVSPRPVRFLVAEDLYNHRYLKPFFKQLGSIPVYRTKSHNGDALRAAVAALERGELLGIFPEGTIYDHGSMRRVKRGVALLAMKTGRPVVPLGIQGTFESFPDGARVPRPRRVQLYLGSPVTYPRAALDPIPESQVAHVSEDIRGHVLHAMREAVPQHGPLRRGGLAKPVQVAIAALLILPLSGFLTLTANASLDPAARA